MLSQQHYRTKHLDDEITEDEFSEALWRNGKDTAPGQDARTGLGEEGIVARKLVRDLQDWENSPSESGGVGQGKHCCICVAMIIMHERFERQNKRWSRKSISRTHTVGASSSQLDELWNCLKGIAGEPSKTVNVWTLLKWAECYLRFVFDFCL